MVTEVVAFNKIFLKRLQVKTKFWKNEYLNILS